MRFLNIIFLFAVFIAAVVVGENEVYPIRAKRHDMLHGDEHFYVVHHHEDKKSEEKDNKEEHHMIKRDTKDKQFVILHYLQK
uniref:Uncharacterized protein n=1 Tax=Panagrolaimus sp. ES5 TaxID=591445 RepID=A0AC34GCM0_9BILA